MKGITPIGVRVLVPASPRLSSGGAPHVPADPHLGASARTDPEAGAWAARTEALQAEARSALRLAFSSPPTWQVG